VAVGMTRPRRSEGRRHSPPIGNGSVALAASRASLQLAVTDHHRPSQTVLAVGGAAPAHPLKPACSLQNATEHPVAPLL